MNARRWDTPIPANGRRSIELVSVLYESNGIAVRVVEEDSERRWTVRFRNVQGLKISTFESSFEIASQLRGEGGFFELTDSAWMAALGAGKREYMNQARHFVLCCYDEVVEVMAWEVSFLKGAP